MAVVGSTYKYDISHPKSLKLDKFILGIAEKKSAAIKIASALSSKSKLINFKLTRLEPQADNSLKSVSLPSVQVHEVKQNGHHLLIIPASGHLFTLIQDGYGWQSG